MQANLQSRQQLLALIRAKAEQVSPCVVAIDGYAGAGKSTLAQWLASELAGSQLISLDDFYAPVSPEQAEHLHGEEALQAYFDVPEFIHKVLIPLQNNSAAQWQPMDWLTQRLGAIKCVQPQGVVLVEGVFAAHKSLLGHVHLSMMVVTESHQCQQRVLARPQPDTHWYHHWAATEDWYHQDNQTASLVDGCYCGTG